MEENKAVSVLLIVTGASKGLGKAITNVFCLVAAQKSLAQVDNLHVILVARSSERLEELGRNILQHHDNLKLSCHSADLSALDQLDTVFDRMFQDVDISSFQRIFFINNHGSLGFLGPIAESPSVDEMRSSIDLNVTSALWLSSRFARLIQESPTATKRKVFLVNISSLLAVESFQTMGIYGAGKAARDHFHRTMGKEIPEQILKTLNYAPGPLETDMVTEIRKAPKLDESLRPAFNKKLIDPGESALKLVKLLLSDSFESGDHVDFYDLPSGEETTD